MTRLYTFPVFCALAAAPLLSGTTLLDQGYTQMYNRQFEAAHRSFSEWSQSHPQDPMGPASQAAAYLFSELDRMRILHAEFFVGDVKLPPAVQPDAVLKQKFDDALDRSRQLSEATLGTSPGDENAMFASIMRSGLRSNYLAFIERRYKPALDEMKSGRMLAEKLLAVDPTCYDAHLAIGVENYLLSQKAAPVRFVLRLGHAQTDKEEGLANLRITAENGRYLKPFAKMLLALAALRDNDRPKARALLQALAAEYPGNPLYNQELARLARL
jgi:hypothetical protein